MRPAVRRVRRNTTAVSLGFAAVAAGSIALSLALGTGSPTQGADTRDRGARAVPHVATTAPTKAGEDTSEAGRIKAMDPVQVAKSVASSDARGSSSSAPGPAKGVWHAGEIGTYLVGKGIAPGTYESAGATREACQWSRLRDLSQKPTDVIQRGSGSGKIRVTIRSGDAFFETSHCQNWHKVS